MIRRSTLAVAALAAIGGLALAGCGGGSSSSSTTAAVTSGNAAGTAGTAGGSAVKISETDFKLDPSDPTVKAGKVTFEASNNGQTTHSLEVEGPAGEQRLKSDLAPGQTGTLTVDLSKPGKYEFYCPIDSHKQMGMEGSITVK